MLISTVNLLLHDNGGNYILCHPYEGCRILAGYRDFSNESEGVYYIGEDVYAEKIYTEQKPKSVYDSMLKIFKQV